MSLESAGEEFSWFWDGASYDAGWQLLQVRSGLKREFQKRAFLYRRTRMHDICGRYSQIPFSLNLDSARLCLLHAYPVLVSRDLDSLGQNSFLWSRIHVLKPAGDMLSLEIYLRCYRCLLELFEAVIGLIRSIMRLEIKGLGSHMRFMFYVFILVLGCSEILACWICR